MEGERSLAMRSRTADRCRSMDVLCDTLMLEILPRLSPKSLIRLGAASRRYNAIVLDPDFAARYWRGAGAFFQPLRTTCGAPELRPLFFLSSSSRRPPSAAAAESMFGADVTFLPGPSTREKAYPRHVGDSDCAGGSVAVVVHSAAGLLLCSRGRVHPVHYYVCNPVSGQWVALPELPCPSGEWQSGLLRVHTDGDTAKKKPKRFQVLLFNHPMHWRKPGGCFDMRLFSSDMGQWKIVRRHPPILAADKFSYWSPIGQSCTAYWIIRMEADGQAIVYNSDDHSVEVIPLPCCSGNGTWKHCRIIGERRGGGLRYAISNTLVFEVWDLQTKGGDRGISLVEKQHLIQLL